MRVADGSRMKDAAFPPIVELPIVFLLLAPVMTNGEDRADQRDGAADNLLDEGSTVS